MKLTPKQKAALKKEAIKTSSARSNPRGSPQRLWKLRFRRLSAEGKQKRVLQGQIQEEDPSDSGNFVSGVSALKVSKSKFCKVKSKRKPPATLETSFPASQR